MLIIIITCHPSQLSQNGNLGFYIEEVSPKTPLDCWRIAGGLLEDCWGLRGKRCRMDGNGEISIKIKQIERKYTMNLLKFVLFIVEKGELRGI